MYDFTDITDIPPFIPVGGDRKVTATGSAHNKSGELKKNDPETLEMLKHLEEKILSRSADMETITADTREGAGTLVLSFGITARAAREAVRRARTAGRPTSFVNLKTLFPVPEASLRAAAAGTRRVVVAEENMHGQYRGVIRHLFPDADVVGVNKVGSMITPDEIYGAIA